MSKVVPITDKSNIIIVFDTETTGFSPEKNEIVQLSYIVYDTNTKNPKVIHATTTPLDIVDVNGLVPSYTTAIHGISKNDTIGKRPIKEHIDEFIKYCDMAGKFVGHNISFDIKMIVGQINKIMEVATTEDKTKYTTFLERFNMIGKALPDDAYCTMTAPSASKTYAECRGDMKTKKKEKLMEVHKLLFNENVTGKLHNAIVDVCVTLRVFLMLTQDIDICLEYKTGLTDTESSTDTTLNTNQHICSLIQPVNIGQHISELIEYNGELITGIVESSSGDNTIITTEKIMINTIRKVAEEVAKNVIAEGIQNASSQIASTQDTIQLETPTHITDIMICKAVIKTGKNKDNMCGRVVKQMNKVCTEFCGYHAKKTNKVAPAGGRIRHNKHKTTQKRRPKKRTNKKRKNR